MQYTATVNQLLGLLTVIAQAGIIVLLAAFGLPKTGKPVLRFVNKHALKLAFVVAVVATAGSLFYSDVAGYEPCKLCWFQRIFMYPQVVLLGLALKKKDYSIIDYSLVLSVIGGLIAGYHYLLQVGVAPSLPCSAVGYSVSCSQRFVLQYGYITIPLMAATAFAALIILLFLKKKGLPAESR